MVQSVPIIDFRVFVLVKIGYASDTPRGVLRPNLPLLGFRLLMVFILTRVQCLRSETVTLQKPLVKIRNFLRFTALPLVKTAPLSREDPAIPRFFAFNRPSLRGLLAETP